MLRIVKSQGIRKHPDACSFALRRAALFSALSQNQTPSIRWTERKTGRKEGRKEGCLRSRDGTSGRSEIPLPSVTRRSQSA